MAIVGIFAITVRMPMPYSRDREVRKSQELSPIRAPYIAYGLENRPFNSVSRPNSQTVMCMRVYMKHRRRPFLTLRVIHTHEKPRTDHQLHIR